MPERRLLGSPYRLSPNAFKQKFPDRPLPIIGAREVGFAMARITKNDAEQAIIREWRALPEIKRQADSHAEWFAMMIKDKYPFRHSGRDRYQAVHKIIIRYQNLVDAPLK